MQTLDQQLALYRQRRFTAMPIAGTIAWLVVGIGSLFLSLQASVYLLFGATGMIVYLGMFLSKFTGENFLDKTRPKNPFDAFFFHTVAMAVAVYAIAIPFFLVEPTSLPLSVGILSGLMWIPLSWAIQHWVGIFHTVTRTVAILALYYLFPEDRFVTIPFAIVAVYMISIWALERRYRAVQMEAA
ncbi:MAG: hypothetical protein AB8H12_19635 [Lewinella sp.]